MSTTLEDVVALRNVSVSYAGRPALRNVTAAFGRGATGLVGANGAGKSTLIRAVLGLVSIDAGSIDVFGTDASRSPLTLRARIGYVPERDASIPGLNAIESVAFCARLAGIPAQDALLRAHDVVTYVGLDEARYRIPETLSTGLRQRLKFAQALVHDPDLLLLDEPTSGVDPRGREGLLALMHDLKSRARMSLVVSTHLLREIERLCDAIVMLRTGSVAAQGPVNDWREWDRRTFELRIKGDARTMLAALEQAGVAHEAADDDALRITLPDGDPRLVFAVASRLGMQVRHLRPARAALEATYERLSAAEAPRA